jgi:hypothetical protein
VSETLFYYPGDDNWWLGHYDASQPSGQTLQWELVGNTAGFGHAINDGRPFWTGNFRGADQADILFYYPGDDNWWLGHYDASQPSGQTLQWELVGNTANFGHAINDGRPFWIGDFKGLDRDGVLFYYPGDDNWWLGTYDASQPSGQKLQWELVGNTANFGHAINDGRPFWIGDFKSNGKDGVLFYYPGDDNWWLGTYDASNGGGLSWELVSNTANFGHGIDDGRPFWIGNVKGGGQADVLFYYPGDDNWWLGTYHASRPAGAKMKWVLVSNTANFGHGIDDGRPFWVGDFLGPNKDQIVFYYPGDDNWWIGDLSGKDLLV